MLNVGVGIHLHTILGNHLPSYHTLARQHILDLLLCIF